MFYSVVERAYSGKVIPGAAVMLLCCHSFHVYIMFFLQSLYAANSRECKLLSHPWYSTSRFKGKQYL